MRTLTEKEFRKAEKQFPFLRSITNYRDKIFEGDDFKIRLDVQVADAELMYTIPKLCEGELFVESIDKKYIGQFQSVGFAIDDQNNIIRRVSWDSSNFYSFFKKVVGDGVGVKTTALVVRYIWYHYSPDWFNKGKKLLADDFSHYEQLVSIIKEPKQGFAALVSESNLSKNVRITTLLQINGAALDGHNPEATAAMIEIESLVSMFQDSIALELWKKMEKNGKGSMSGVFGNTTLSTNLFLDRGIHSEDLFDVGFIRGTVKITFIASRRSLHKPGICRIDCTIDQAKNLIQDVVDNWDVNKLTPQNINPFW